MDVSLGTTLGSTAGLVNPSVHRCPEVDGTVSEHLAGGRVLAFRRNADGTPSGKNEKDWQVNAGCWEREPWPFGKPWQENKNFPWLGFMMPSWRPFKGRKELALFGAQAVNAYVERPRMTQDVDVLALEAGKLAEEIRELLSRRYSLPPTRRIDGFNIVAPAELIAEKVTAFHRRRGRPKSGTDWRDLALLLQTFPDLESAVAGNLISVPRPGSSTFTHWLASRSRTSAGLRTHRSSPSRAVRS